MEENTMATNFEPHECIIFVQSTKIGTHENKAIHSNYKLKPQVCHKIGHLNNETNNIKEGIR